MTVSKIASDIYQTAKAASAGSWEWRLEWSKAMKQAWSKIMSNKWKFEAKGNAMIFFWSPVTEGRGMLDCSTIEGDVIYNKTGLGVTLLNGERSNIGLKISNKPELAESIQQAINSEATRKPARKARAVYNWIQSEGYDPDGNSVPCPC